MKPQAIKVLDHGSVMLLDHMGSDLSIVRAARVSYDAHWRAGEDQGSDNRLINYLWKNRHTTPFEAVTFTFDIKAPIFIFRQWHRHRMWSYNELSARYRELPEEFYIPEAKHIGIQSTDNKQVRNIISLDDMDDTRVEQLNEEIELLKETNRKAFDTYRELIASGWPRELARSVLPVSTYSHMQATVNLHSLLHFLNLRTHSHAQYEIRVYAEAMLELIRPIVPVAIQAWEKSRESN